MVIPPRGLFFQMLYSDHHEISGHPIWPGWMASPLAGCLRHLTTAYTSNARPALRMLRRTWKGRRCQCSPTKGLWTCWFDHQGCNANPVTNLKCQQKQDFKLKVIAINKYRNNKTFCVNNKDRLHVVFNWKKFGYYLTSHENWSRNLLTLELWSVPSATKRLSVVMPEQLEPEFPRVLWWGSASPRPAKVQYP